MGVGLIRGDSPLLQDAGKLINKFWELSNLEKPPYRVAFGEDAKVWDKRQLEATVSDSVSLGLLHSEMDRFEVGFRGQRGVVERPGF